MNWEVIAKIINSRVGLVVLFIIYTSCPYGLGTKIDSIIQNLDKVLIALNSSDQVSAKNNEMLIRIEERQRLECRATSKRLEVAKR